MRSKKIVFIVLLSLLIFSGFFSFLVRSRGEKGSFFARLLKSEKGPALGVDSFDTVKVRPKPASLKVPILLYHYIEDVTDERDFLRSSMATRPYFFEIQMNYLSTQGYTAITLTDLKKALTGEGALPEKSVIITFDDGYRDFYYNAFPILRKYKLKAIVYVIVNHIGRSGNLTSEMLREMTDSGVFELGSHTLNHVWLSRVSRGEAKREIFESKKSLSELFSYDVKDFSYPGGFEDQAVENLVKEAGYETAVTTKEGIAQTLGGILELKRLRVGNLNEAAFAARLEGKGIRD